LTLWPLQSALPSIVDGYSIIYFRPLEFSPDGRWLATLWPDNSLRLWPLPGTGTRQVTSLPLPSELLGRDLAFDPLGRFLIVVAYQDTDSGSAYVVPLNGSSPSRLEGLSDGHVLSGAAVSPSGRLVAAGSRNAPEGTDTGTLRVWDLTTGELRLFELPEGSFNEQRLQGGVWDLAFADESTLYTSGDGGVRRWNLDTGSHELVLPTQPGSVLMSAAFGPDAQTAVVTEPMPGDEYLGPARVLDLATGEARAISSFADSAVRSPTLWPRDAFDAAGTIAATGDRDGIVRVARLSGGEPHLLLGHKGTVSNVAISPDGRWIASAGEDNTLRLWPMPDLDQAPLHALPHDELIAKLKSLTNLRAVRDPGSSTGWSIEVGPFPGWKEVPTW